MSLDGESPDVRRKCLRWLIDNFRWAIEQPELMRAIDVDSLAELLLEDDLDVEDEEMRFQAISNWEEQRLGHSNTSELERLVDRIDWTLIPEQRLFNITANEQRGEYR